uniref:Uncharacterized protein n=2 Tax=Plectus sambesii TaxID=2011161 RepID=A0A914UZZ5_9BILA
MPELFRPVQEMLPAADDNCSSPELPFYLCVRLSRRRKRKRGAAPSVSNDDSAFGNQLKREFWFAVPRERAEAVYHFLLQWSPDKYGQDSLAEKEHDEKGFLILEGDDDDALGGDKPSTPLFGSMLNREWEIVTVEEMRRRLSLSELSLEDLPLPEGATTSRVLDEPMIRQLLEILPARAEGYPWVKVYSSAEHGFSLK